MFLYNPLTSLLNLFKEPVTAAASSTIIPDDYNPLLYSSFEAHRKVKESCTAWTSLGMQYQLMGLQWMRALGNPFTQRSESLLEASLAMNERFGRDYTKPRFNIERVETLGGPVSVTKEVIEEKAFASLLHFKRDTQRQDPKLLVVAPMSGHYATLLRDTIASLVPNHEVYLTDWKNAREVPLDEGSFGFDDYVTYIVDFLTTLGPDTHVLAVCQPTVPTMVATASMESISHPCSPITLTLMGGPIDAGASPTKVTEFADKHSLNWFKKNVIARVPSRFPGAGRLVYPGFLQLQGFIAMNLETHCRSHVELFKDLIRDNEQQSQRTTDFYDEYLAVCDLPARFYLETIDRVFLRQDLANNSMRYRGELVSASSITKAALFTVEGEKDDISAPGQTIAAHRLCSNLEDSKKFHYTQPGAGHYGVFSGSRWRSQIAPRITSFIRAHNAQACDQASSSIPV